MAFTSHIFSGQQRWGALSVGVSTGLAAVLLAMMIQRVRLVDVCTAPGVEAPDAPALDFAAALPSLAPAFAVLQGMTDSSAGVASFLADYRFVGTFFTYGADDAGAQWRRGVLSYLPSQQQDIVSEGSVLEGATVVALHEDRIVLAKDGVTGALMLGQASGDLRTSLQSTASQPAVAATSSTRFGEQTGDGVWSIEKKALADYYEELLDAPERLLQVFDSMRPLYGEDGSYIEGYTLQAVGEKEFFEAVGFREGDVVRRVNSLDMTNRGRAEFFIKQVVQDRLSAIVIDIEREGAKKRLVYQLR